MKKLCHIFFDEYPKDSRIRRYTNALLEKRVEIFIVCINDGSYSFFEKEKNTNIYRLSLKKKRNSFIRRLWEYIIFQIFATTMVSYIAIRHNVKIFQVHTLPDFLVFSCIIPKLKGSNIILDFHELFPELMMQFNPDLNSSSLTVKILYLLEKLSFNFATHIITLHDPAKEILLKRINSMKPVTTVMNGVDISEIPDFKKRNSDEFKIIYNGTINYNLNLSLVVKALNVIKNRCPEIYNNIGFYLYGDGPDVNRIKRISLDLGIEKVRFKGRYKFKDMIKELETASVCILPPKKDVYSDLYYSLKLTEMIYLKIPVIATRLETYCRYYPENCLIYFDSENVEELADKIIFVYKNRSDLSSFTDNAFNEYQKINWEIMKERYINIIKSL